MLRRRNQKDPRMGNWVELQDYVASFGIEEKSLQKIYALLFQEKISKSQRLSNWEADTLTEAQQLYAATDAWACVRIYQLPGRTSPFGQVPCDTLRKFSRNPSKINHLNHTNEL